MFDRLKSLPLVVIITVLIWLYAEAQFTARQDNVRIAVKIAAPPGEHTLRVLDASDDRGRGVVNFTITVQGAKGQVEQIYQQSLGVGGSEDSLGPLTFVPKANELETGEQSVVIDSVSMLNSMRHFRDAGVVVTAASPPRVRIEVDKLVRLSRPVEAQLNGPVSLVSLTPMQAMVTVPARTLSRMGGAEAIRVIAVPQVDVTTLPAETDQTVAVRLSVDSREVARDERLTVAPLQGTLVIRTARQPEQTLVVGDVPVMVNALPATFEKYKVEVRPATLRLTLAGTESAIAPLREKLTNGSDRLGLRAILEVRADEKPEKDFVRRALRFDLPAGVRVSEGQMDVEYRLVERAGS